jgi:superfamily II DNA or RNA helicase
MSQSSNKGLFDALLRAEGPPEYHLFVTLDAGLGGFRFEWKLPGSDAAAATGELLPHAQELFRWFALDWQFRMNGQTETDQRSGEPSAIRALFRRISRRLPLAPDGFNFGFCLDAGLADFEPGLRYGLKSPGNQEWPAVLARLVHEFVKGVAALPRAAGVTPRECGRNALREMVRRHLRLAPEPDTGRQPARERVWRLHVTLECVSGFIGFDWTRLRDGGVVAAGRVTCSGRDELTWELTLDGGKETAYSGRHLNSIRGQLRRWLSRWPAANEDFSAHTIVLGKGRKPESHEEPPFAPDESPWPWLEQTIQTMAEQLPADFSPLDQVMDTLVEPDPEFLRYEQRFLRKEQERAEAEERRRETMERLARERREKEAAKAAQRKAIALQRAERVPQPAPAAPPPAAPPPAVPLRIEPPELAFQETAFPLENLDEYFLRERAAQWWVSNQSDNLIALPYCRIQRLEYQVRTALRVLGPLRGRALLSDEVGLGKTIEAGLALKEWLTRGMVKRFLVLTVPSLVDQWEAELSEKFNLATATTNHAAFRAEAETFWCENSGIIASLHTVKQPAHLEIARAIQWDLVIVDEAHYLRNRESQAWQAVNALPRRFLLLLTATPVQNSLEELYNLVTLLQPGQLPSPKEFRARFMDPKRPRQPREPEELRRLLGQVMIRNTRANAGLQLPPRRAETALFEPDAAERGFWEKWETELRAELAGLPPSQQSLWGRLLLQAAGSSPAAWRAALEKFPKRECAAAWREHAPLESSWRKKCELLPPLAAGEGGVVVFTQFLHTQAALAESLRAAGVETFVMHGGTPATERQPLTELFRKRGGALLLTHSGTEGRNLQFCHRLVNFDLPWNPMEIEQRIGRLHRLGQQQPVRIYNLVQRGTLQEHLLEILQEKLNLFELVVGETGLILGERFAGDEFADEIFRRWRESEGRVGEALAALGNELAAARGDYQEVKELDETLFAKDYESL